MIEMIMMIHLPIGKESINRMLTVSKKIINKKIIISKYQTREHKITKINQISDLL
jgi:hypothetical protein